MITNLFTFPCQSIKNRSICAVRKSTLLTSFLIYFRPLAQSFWSIVKCITEWLMYTSERISASHEDLGTDISSWTTIKHRVDVSIPTRSNAVEHERGCVVTKIGLLDIMSFNAVTHFKPKRVLRVLYKQSVFQVELVQCQPTLTVFQING
jgi:hypothetical protein